MVIPFVPRVSKSKYSVIGFEIIGIVPTVCELLIVYVYAPVCAVIIVFAETPKPVINEPIGRLVLLGYAAVILELAGIVAAAFKVKIVLLTCPVINV